MKNEMLLIWLGIAWSWVIFYFLGRLHAQKKEKPKAPASIPLVGSVYVLGDGKNPFAKVYVQIAAVSNDYVAYRFLNQGLPFGDAWSMATDRFQETYTLMEPRV